MKIFFGKRQCKIYNERRRKLSKIRAIGKIYRQSSISILSFSRVASMMSSLESHLARLSADAATTRGHVTSKHPQK